jgi:hypothetical protein
LPFFFSRDPSFSIPLHNLEYHSIYINIQLKPVKNWFTILDSDTGLRIPPNSISDIEILPNETFKFNLRCSVCFLENDLLKVIRLAKYETLIEQVQVLQTSNIDKKNIKIPIYSKKAMKEFFIIAYRSDNIHRNIFNNYSNYEDNYKNGDLSLPSEYLSSLYNSNDYLKQIYYEKNMEFNDMIIDDIQLFIDEKPRFHILKSNYLRLVQSYQHDLNFQKENNYIYYYSFSNYPKEIQPSGVLNLGRVSKCELDINLMMTPPKQPISTNLLRTFKKAIVNSDLAWTYTIKVYLINYNVFKIFGGMCDITFKK